MASGKFEEAKVFELTLRAGVACGDLLPRGLKVDQDFHHNLDFKYSRAHDGKATLVLLKAVATATAKDALDVFEGLRPLTQEEAWMAFQPVAQMEGLEGFVFFIQETAVFTRNNIWGLPTLYVYNMGEERGGSLDYMLSEFRWEYEEDSCDVYFLLAKKE